MPTISHSALNISATLNDFSQAQFETYQSEILAQVKGKEDTAANSNGAIVRAALKAGFLTGIPEDIGSMSPAAVKWLTKKIHEHVVKVTTPPPDEQEAERKN